METIIRILSIIFRFQTDTGSERQAEESVAKFAQSAMKQLKNIGAVAAAIAFDKVVQNLLKATSQAEDTAFVFENIYGELSDTQEEWAEDFANTYNRSATKVKETLAQIQHEMVGFTKAGTDQEKRNVAEMSKTIEEAALNLGAFYGLDSKTAINTLISATEGSDAAMQTFNVGQGKTLTQNRQQAMRELQSEGTLSAFSAKSYENLTPYEKSLVNLRTVLNANKEATDALSRSQGNYSTMQENLQESLDELKETLGEFFLPTAKKIVDFLTKIIRGLNDGLQFIKKITDALGLTEPIMESLVMLFAALVAIKVAGWASGVVKSFSSIVGIVQTLMGGVGTFAGGVGNASTALVSLGDSATAAGSTMTGAMGAAAASTMLLLAALAAVVAVVRDITKFLNGEESVTGKALDKLGISAEKAAPYLEALRNILVAVTSALVVLKVVSIATGTAIMATPIGWIIAAIAALIAVIVVVIKYWDKIRDAVTGAFNTIKEKVKAVFDWIKDKISKVPDWALALSTLFLGPIGPIILLIRHFDKLKEAAKKAWDFVKRIFGGKGDSRQSGKDMVEEMAEGMEEGKPVLKAKTDEMAQTVDDTLGFSLPETGPLSDFDKSMPDMVDVMAQGMEKGKPKLLDAASSLAAIIKGAFSVLQNPMVGLMALNGFNPGTLAMAGGMYGVRNLTNNITFTQEFNGPEQMDQKLARAAEESADSIIDKVTSSLAKLL